MLISPMLVQTAPRTFSHSDYIYEPKIDGHRLIFSQKDGKVRLYTRHNNDCTRQYPELQLPFDDDIILDGEVACVVDPTTGVSDFEAIMSQFQTRRADKISKPLLDLCISRGLSLREIKNTADIHTHVSKKMNESSMEKSFPPQIKTLNAISVKG